MSDFDENGNPDVMGSRPLTDSQKDTIAMLRREYNALHSRISGAPGQTPESARLFAMARTQLEISYMTAVKAVSRT